MSIKAVPMKKSAAADLRERCKATIKRIGLTDAAAAREIGISPSVLSSWNNETYKGDLEKINAIVEKWLAVQNDRRQFGLPRIEHIALSITEELCLIIAHVHATRDCGLIFGSAGTGKSHAADYYKEHHTQVAFATMSPAVSSTLAVLRRIASSMGLSSDHIRSAAQLEDMLVKHLIGRNAVIIIDEAHHLNQALLDEIRCIHDRAECGLVLMGNEPLLARLMGGERAAQLMSRIGITKRLGLPATGDVDTLASSLIGRELSPAEIKAIRAVACLAGGLRAVAKTIQTAQIFARGADRKQVAPADLMAAIEEAA